ncbi:MAG: hypothetical protein ACKOW2_01995 [Sphingobacteriaceae bacterium]
MQSKTTASIPRSRSLLPKGVHYSQILPYYKLFLEKGLSIKQLATATRTPEMTVRVRLHLANIKIKTTLRTEMLIAAYSYKYSTKTALHVFGSLITELKSKTTPYHSCSHILATWRFTLKRSFNVKRATSSRPPITDLELAATLEAPEAQKALSELLARVTLAEPLTTNPNS